MYIVDFSDKTNPVVISSYSNYFTVEDIAFSSGSYGFTVQGRGGLIVIDLSNFNNIQPVASFTDISNVQDVAIYQNYGILALSSEIEFYDLNDLSSPSLINAINISKSIEGYMINAVDVFDHYLILSSATKGILIYDIKDISQPTQVYSIDIFAIKNIKVSQDYLFVNLNNQLLIYDLSSITNPTFLSKIDFNETTFITDMDLNQNNVLAVSEGEYGVSFYDLTDPSQPALTSHYAIDGSLEYLAFYKGFLYVTEFFGGFYVIDASDPYSIESVYHYNGFAGPYLEVFNDFLFVFGYYLNVYSLENPQSPSTLLKDHYFNYDKLAITTNVILGTSYDNGFGVFTYQYQLNEKDTTNSTGFNILASEYLFSFLGIAILSFLKLKRKRNS